MINDNNLTCLPHVFTNHTRSSYTKIICILVAFLFVSCSIPSPEITITHTYPTIKSSPATEGLTIEADPLLEKNSLLTRVSPPESTDQAVATPVSKPNDYPSFIVYTKYPERKFIIFDSNGEINFQIKLDDSFPTVKSVSDGMQSCELLITTVDGNEFQLLRYQLQEQQTELFFQSSIINPSNEIGHISLSPNKKWVSYVVHSGISYYSTSEFQDIEVISVSNNESRFRLSSLGGALSPPDWSSDGERIAFSDYDTSGKQQLIVVEPTGKNRTIIDTLEGENTKIGDISWSPNDEMISYIVYRNFSIENSDLQPELWIADLIKHKVNKIDLPKKVLFFNGLNYWSEKGDKFLIGYTSSKNIPGFFWVEIGTYSVEYWIDESSLKTLNPSVIIIFPFIVSTDLSRIGFLHRNNLTIFDKKSQVISRREFSSLSDQLVPISINLLQRFYGSCK